MPSPPSAVFLLIGIGMMAVAVVAVLAWRRRTRAPWAAFGLGALAWAVAVALKIGWALPMNPIVRRGLDKGLPGSVSAPLFWLYIGLLTGVFECGIALLFVKRTRLKSAGWDGAIAFGIGFGAAEAFILGMINFLALLAAIAFWERVPEVARTALIQSPIVLGVAYVPLPIAERLSALAAHVFTCVLIVYGVRAKDRRWFWLSFAYKSALDAFAAWAILATGFSKSITGMIAFESAAGVFAFLGLAGLAFLRGRFRSPANPREGTRPA